MMEDPKRKWSETETTNDISAALHSQRPNEAVQNLVGSRLTKQLLSSATFLRTVSLPLLISVLH